jgi:4-aminobutyrate aminotransferase-like enzyme
MGRVHATSPVLAADRLRGDPRITSARALLLEALASNQLMIDGVRPPDPALRAGYADLIAQTELVRGGRLLYPYLASGLGRGALVELADGSVKYDLIAGVGTHHLGHSHPAVVSAAIDAALMDTVMEGNLQSSVAGQAFAREVRNAATESGAPLAHCFVSTSGAMACENALKIAFQARYPADRVLAFTGCFAGRTLATVQITDRPAFRDGLPRTLAVDYVPFFDHRDHAGSTAAARTTLRQHLRRYPGRHAAMIFELVLGEGGFYDAPAEFHGTLMETCREEGVLVLVDEVQTFLRTSRPLAFQHLELDHLVDAVWVGKASQACATLFGAEIAPRAGLVTQTFTSSTAALLCGTAIIRHLRGGQFFGPSGRIELLSRHFRGRLADIASRHPGLLDGPWGCGAMVACTPHGGGAGIVKAFLDDLYERGVIALAAGTEPTRARFLLPVGGITEADLDCCAQLIEESLLATAAS